MVLTNFNNKATLLSCSEKSGNNGGGCNANTVITGSISKGESVL